MDRIPLHAEGREVLGKKVKKLRHNGQIPGHVYGKGVSSEHVSVLEKDLLKVISEAGETGLVDLRIGAEKVRPVLIRGMQYNPVSGSLLHVDFHQVSLTEKVKVPVPIELIGEEPEVVHMGDAVVLQNLHEVLVEALPTDLIEKFEVDITSLKAVEDAISVAQLNFDRAKLTIVADNEEVVVKLAPAVTEEMKKLLEEQEAEVAAAAVESVAEEGVEVPAEGEVTEEAAGEGTEENKEAPSTNPEESKEEAAKG